MEGHAKARRELRVTVSGPHTLTTDFEKY